VDDPIMAEVNHVGSWPLGNLRHLGEVRGDTPDHFFGTQITARKGKTPSFVSTDRQTFEALVANAFVCPDQDAAVGCRFLDPLRILYPEGLITIPVLDSFDIDPELP
jgi:hypothetical protein